MIKALTADLIWSKPAAFNRSSRDVVSANNFWASLNALRITAYEKGSCLAIEGMEQLG
jgi:hypothetical protein